MKLKEKMATKKEEMKVKKAEFAEKHPKASKALDTCKKVGAGIVVGVAGTVTYACVLAKKDENALKEIEHVEAPVETVEVVPEVSEVTE